MADLYTTMSSNNKTCLLSRHFLPYIAGITSRRRSRVSLGSLASTPQGPLFGYLHEIGMCARRGPHGSIIIYELMQRIGQVTLVPSGRYGRNSNFGFSFATRRLADFALCVCLFCVCFGSVFGSASFVGFRPAAAQGSSERGPARRAGPVCTRAS